MNSTLKRFRSQIQSQENSRDDTNDSNEDITEELLKYSYSTRIAKQGVEKIDRWTAK